MAEGPYTIEHCRINMLEAILRKADNNEVAELTQLWRAAKQLAAAEKAEKAKEREQILQQRMKEQEQILEQRRKYLSEQAIPLVNKYLSEQAIPLSNAILANSRFLEQRRKPSLREQKEREIKKTVQFIRAMDVVGDVPGQRTVEVTLKLPPPPQKLGLILQDDLRIHPTIFQY